MADTTDTTPENAPRTTPFGSPCSPNWDDAWCDRVSYAETKAGKRICGAHLHDGTPCPLGPNHANGRCRYHGGFAGILLRASASEDWPDRLRALRSACA